LDRAQHVFGYELLFRNGVEDYFNADPELAARSTVPCFSASARFAITAMPL
jgi:c-di-GMP-related signal transduction protein